MHHADCKEVRKRGASTGRQRSPEEALSSKARSSGYGSYPMCPTSAGRPILAVDDLNRQADAGPTLTPILGPEVDQPPAAKAKGPFRAACFWTRPRGSRFALALYRAGDHCAGLRGSFAPAFGLLGHPLVTRRASPGEGGRRCRTSRGAARTDDRSPSETPSEGAMDSKGAERALGSATRVLTM